VSDECSCECTSESFSFNFGRGSVYPEPVTYVSADQREVVRGPVAGDFRSDRNIKCLIHTDWCCHRPTKAAASAYSDYNANGTLRVFVEAKPDFSTYVWAEAQFEGAVAFPAFDEKIHYRNDSTHRVPSYEVSFGVAARSFSFTPRGDSDPTSYMTTPWPVMPPTGLSFDDDRPRIQPGAVVDGEYRYEGSRLTYRYGYRDAGTDVVVDEMMNFLNAGTYRYGGVYGVQPFSIGSKNFSTGAISCHWDDIEEEREDATVRCGYSNSTSFWGFLDGVDPTASAGFSFGFSVPRSLFVDSESSADPKPYDNNRYVGLEQSGSAVTVFKWRPFGSGYEYALDRSSSDVLGARAAEISVTCSADSAAVIIDPADSDYSTVPLFSAMSGADSSPVTASTPFFSRRPDLTQRNSVPSGDTWHASHLVRKGSSLATPNALHSLNVEFVEISSLGPESAFNWYGAYGGLVRAGVFDISFVAAVPGAGSSPYCVFSLTNELSLWQLLSGSHTLEPYSQGRRLMPNMYSVLKDSPTRTKQYSEPPYVFPGGYRTIGPVVAGEFEKRGNSYPDDAIWRATYTLASYPQIWAWTRVFQGSAGPIQSGDLSLDASGMTTENYDKYSISEWPFIDIGREVVVRVQARIGLKITLDEVRWYRDELQFKEFYGGGSSYNVYETTGGVESGTVSCGDSAVTEYFYNVDIPLTAENVAAISDGETVSVEIDEFRTANVSISIA